MEFLKRRWISLVQIGIILLAAKLREDGILDGKGFAGVAIGGVLLVTALYYGVYLRMRRRHIEALRKLAPLLTKDPDAYLEKVNEELLRASSFERDELTLHKANVLSLLHRDREAADTLSGNVPKSMDAKNRAIYFSNLLGLYLKLDDLDAAARIREAHQAEFYRFRHDPAFGYSILTHEAIYAAKTGDAQGAEAQFAEAMAHAPTEKVRGEIRRAKDALLRKK